MRKKKLYVVGYDNDWNCIYGKDKDICNFCHPMTAFDAKRLHKKMPSENPVIYKLVKVDPKKI